MLIFVLLLVFGYLCGSIPFGFIISKARGGIDIKKIGSKGTTATNVSRIFGWRWGTLTILFDIFKSIIPTYIALKSLTDPLQLTIVALMQTLGHIFPVWTDFKGGRGASTFFGSAIILVGFKFFIVSFIVWITILCLFRTMSLTNLIFAWIFTCLLLIYFPGYLSYGFFGASLITFALRDNIKRLRKGKELKISFKW